MSFHLPRLGRETPVLEKNDFHPFFEDISWKKESMNLLIFCRTFVGERV